MKWRIIAIAVSLIPFLLLFIFTPLSPGDVFLVGLLPFLLSVASVMVRILLQAYRFAYYIKHFIGPNISTTFKTMNARIAGEFVTQTTPSFIGGEIIRIAWLIKNGVSAGKAAWVATTEIITDVFVGSMLALIAGILSILSGGSFIGVFIILVTTPTFVFWILVIILSAKRNIQLPKFASNLIRKFSSKERSERVVNSTNNALEDLCKMSRENFTSFKTVKVLSVGIAITFIAFTFQGISFLVLAEAVGQHVGLFQSFMATSAATALSTLPITIGGSGLAELGVWAYITNINSIPQLYDVLNSSQLSVIIAWRIATYHIPLVIMWIALMKITIGKDSIANQIKSKKNSVHKSSDKQNHKKTNTSTYNDDKLKDNP